MPELGEVRAAWDARSTESADPRWAVARPVTDEVFESMICDIKSKLELRPTDRLLDAGCGNGDVLSRLAKVVSSVSGTDLSEEMVQAALKLLPNFEFYRCEAASLPFSDSTFDRVLSYSVFHYFPSVSYALNAIDELCRVCTPGGLVMVGDLPCKHLKRGVLSFQREVWIKTSMMLRHKPRSYTQWPPPIHDPIRWLYFDIHAIAKYVSKRGHEVRILDQSPDLILASTRRDLLIRVGERKEST